MTEWDIGSMVLAACSSSGAALESHHECALLQVGTHPGMTIDFARM